VKNTYHSFTHNMEAKGSWHRNYVTVILCVDRYLLQTPALSSKPTMLLSIDGTERWTDGHSTDT